MLSYGKDWSIDDVHIDTPKQIRTWLCWECDAVDSERNGELMNCQGKGVSIFLRN